MADKAEAAELWDDLRASIGGEYPDRFLAMPIVETPSGGFHIYYYCDTIEGNQKLAATKTGEVVIETRGEGGYVVAPGSVIDGRTYRLTQGALSDIPKISPIERSGILAICRRFNENRETEQAYTPKRLEHYQRSIGDPFTAYNMRGDVEGLLTSHGWTVVPGRDPNKTFFLRPGGNSATSANFHNSFRTLRVWSTSIPQLSPGSYRPADLFVILEHNGDQDKAARALLAAGYGEPSYKMPAPQTIVAAGISVEIETGNHAGRITAPGETLDILDVKKADPVDRFCIYYSGTTPAEEVERAIELIQAADRPRVFLRKVTDPNQPEQKAKAIHAGEYKAAGIVAQYKQREPLDAIQQADLVEALAEIAATIQDPLLRGIFTTNILKTASDLIAGITPVVFAQVVNKLESRQAEQANLDAITRDHQAATVALDGRDIVQYREKMAAILARAEDPAAGAISGRFLEPNSLNALYEAHAKIGQGIPSGWDVYKEGRRISLRWPPATLSVILAKSGHGKTRAMLNSALEIVGKNPGKQVIFFTFEQTVHELQARAINAYANIPGLNPSIGSNSEFIQTYLQKQGQGIDHHQFTTKLEEFYRLYMETGRLRFYEVSGLNAGQLSKEIITLHNQHGDNLAAVFVDYIQKIRPSSGAGKNAARYLEIKDIAETLERTALATNLPIITAGQMNKDNTDSPEKITIENAREGADIGNAAGLVVSIWDYANKENKEPRQAVRLEVLKSRNIGTGGIAEIPFTGETGRMGEATRATDGVSRRLEEFEAAKANKQEDHIEDKNIPF